MNTNDPAAERLRIFELENEVSALRAQLEGDLPRATAWLQRKVWAQAAAADAMNRRILNQRFVLRTIDELGRGLTPDEWAAARDAVSNEQVRTRLVAPAAA